MFKPSLLIVVLLVGAAAACGQKGPLVLPDTEPATSDGKRGSKTGTSAAAMTLVEPVATEDAAARSLDDKPMTTRQLTTKPISAKQITTRPLANKSLANKPLATKPFITE